LVHVRFPPDGPGAPESNRCVRGHGAPGQGDQTTIRYAPKADALHVKFGPDGENYDGADDVAPGVFVEFDPDGNAIGVEVPSVCPHADGTPPLLSSRPPGYPRGA